MKEPDKIHKNVYLLGWVSLFTDLSSQMIYPLVPGFLTSMGASASVIGLIEGISESVASLFKTIFGKYSDRLNRRKGFVLTGYGISAISKPLLALTNTWIPVMGLRIGDRMGKAIRNPARDAMISLSVNSSIRGKAFGIQRGMDRLGAAGGSVLAWLVLMFTAENVKMVFLFAGIPALFALVFIPFTREVLRQEENSTHDQNKRTMDRGFMIFLIAVIIFTLGNSSNAFLLLKASEVGISMLWLPLVWLVYNAVASISSPILGSLSDRWNRRSMIVFSFLVYAIIYLGFAFSTQSYQVWLLFAAFGLYYGLTNGIFKAYIADHVSGESRATAYGLFQTGTGIALLPASLIMGYVWDLYGSEKAFLVSVFFSILGLVVFIFSGKTSDEGQVADHK